MGMDITALKACQILHSHIGAFGNVLTVGKQWLHVNQAELASIGAEFPDGAPKFCEPLILNLFGASDVTSLDASDYEGADLVVDLNANVDLGKLGKYDVVLDFGTLEHVFDVRNAFDTVSKLVKVGGFLIHVLPANQECGHGFYQYSPEFFFSYYSEARGFANPNVFTVSTVNPKFWYKVPRPVNGERVNVASSTSLYVVCITKCISDETLGAIQQSDYDVIWNDAQPHTSLSLRPERSAREKLKGRLPNFLLSHVALWGMFRRVRSLFLSIDLVIRPVKSNVPLEKMLPSEVKLKGPHWSNNSQ